MIYKKIASDRRGEEYWTKKPVKLWFRNRAHWGVFIAIRRAENIWWNLKLKNRNAELWLVISKVKRDLFHVSILHSNPLSKLWSIRETFKGRNIQEQVWTRKTEIRIRRRPFIILIAWYHIWWARQVKYWSKGSMTIWAWLT